MAFRECGKCGEQVDEAKAFCSACGNAMLEERERATTSSFDEMDSTVPIGETMYNQMLSDMGLNISRAPQTKKSVTLEPVPAAEPLPKQVSPAGAPEEPNPKIWLITIVVGIALFFLALLVVAAAGVIFYMSRAGG